MTNTALRARELGNQAKSLDLKEQELKLSKADLVRRTAETAKNVAPYILKALKNDGKWYDKYPTDAERFTNFPTFERAGEAKPLIGNKFNVIATLSTDDAHSFAGILSIGVRPGVGYQGNAYGNYRDNAVNQVLMRTKAEVLKSNSRSSVPWEAADLGLNIFATAEIVGFMSTIGLAIKVAQTFAAENRFIGDALLDALGFTASDFRDNLSNIKADYEMWIAQFNNGIVAPHDLTIYDRKSYIFSNIFIDNVNSDKPQIYVFRHETIGTLSNDGSSVQSSTFGGNYLSWKNTLNTMFARLLENPDYQSMYADLRSAFSDNLLALSPFDNTATVVAISAQDTSDQIMNLITPPAAVGVDGQLYYCNVDTGNTWNIHSTTDGYLWQGKLDNTGKPADFPFLTNPNYAALHHVPSIWISRLMGYGSGTTAPRSYLNVGTKEVTGLDMLTMTRLRPLWIVNNNNSNINVRCHGGGTEIPTNLQVYYFDNLAGVAQINKEQVATDYYLNGKISTPSAAAIALLANAYNDIFRIISLMSNFDWAPFVTFTDGQGADNAAKDTRAIFGDVNNYFTVSGEDISKVHRLATSSVLYISSSAFKH